MKTNAIPLVRSLLLLACAGAAGCAAPADAASDEPVATTEDPFTVKNDGWVLPYRGGTGGGDFQWDKCAPDEVIVGLVGNHGQYQNQVGITCARLMPSGAFGADVQHYARGGRTDGHFRTLHCPAGSAVTGLYGFSHTYLDVLAIRCDAPPFTGGHVSYDIFDGASGGDWFFDMCPNGYALHNLGLEWGNWIDGEQGVCAYVDPASPRSWGNVVLHP